MVWGELTSVGWEDMCTHQVSGDRFMPVMLVPFSMEGVSCVPCGGLMDDKPININEAPLV